MESRIEQIDRLFAAIYGDLFAIEEDTLKHGVFNELSVKEMHTIVAIGMYDKKTVGEVSRLLSITLGTLTVATDKLVKKGYAERSRCESDRRIVYLSLTKKGKLLYRVHKQFHNDIAREAFSGLSGEEERILLLTLDKLHRFLSSVYEKEE